MSMQDTPAVVGKVILMPFGADIFESGADALVNPVDAATGAQGKGLAKEFARRFPLAAQSYRSVARKNQMVAGDVFERLACAVQGPAVVWILFAATKQHWGSASRLPYVEQASANIVISVARIGSLRHIAIPALGCGEGGLSWSDVEPIITRDAQRMADAGVNVLIYPPRS